MTNLNIKIPAELTDFLDRRATACGFKSASDYVSDLVARQRDIDELREKLYEGANSGPGEIIDENWFFELHKRASE